MGRLLKFFLVIALVQALTVGQLLLALRWQEPQARLALAGFAASTALLTALWLSSLAGHAVRDALSRASLRFAQERERVLTRAEREKARLVAEGERRLAREQRRTRARANRRALAVGAGLAALGGVMLLAQLVTLGLLTLAAVAGGAGGYWLRARQEGQRRQPALVARTAAGAGSIESVAARPPALLTVGSGDAPFELHPDLRRDCVHAGRFPLCRLLLMNDANYPWFILVPARPGVSEIYQLGEADQQQLLRESTALVRALHLAFAPDRVNVAALGNVVPQLHLHHVARYRTDPAWPAPVWGRLPARPYAEGQAGEVTARLGAFLPPEAGFIPGGV